METIARVGFLPIALILVFDFAASFSIVSLANGRMITFADLPNGASFETVSRAARSIVSDAAAQGRWRILTIAGASFLINVILVASFMAPLVRFAGLGERPAPGLVRAPFAADQMRYVLAQFLSLLALGAVIAPSMAAIGFIARAVDAALSRTYVVFPNTESLHTIQMVSAQEALSGRGEFWLFSYGYIAYLAAAAAVAAFVVAMLHFHPSNRPNAGGSSPFARAGALAWATAFIIAALVIFSLGAGVSEATRGQISMRAFYAAAALLLAYLSLRFAPYPGIAVCRRSMAMAGLFELSRGWNLFRLAGAISVAWLVVVGVQMFAERLILPAIFAGVQSLFTASDSVSRLSNGGERAEWILPFFVWVWTGVLIAYKFVWLFFTYGVSAGVLGELYRESAGAD